MELFFGELSYLPIHEPFPLSRVQSRGIHTGKLPQNITANKFSDVNNSDAN